MKYNKLKLSKSIVVVLSCLSMVACNSELDQAPLYFTDEQILEILNSENEQDQERKNIIIKGLCANLEENFRMDGIYNGYSNHIANNINSQDITLNCRCNDIVVGSQIHSSSTDTYVHFYNLNSDFQPWRGDQSTTGWCYPLWALSCNTLTNANKVLTIVSDEIARKGTPEVKNGRASALCVRALSYMTLMERFQKAFLHGGKGGEGMPIYTEYKINTPIPPASADETFDFIKKDLDEAIKLYKEADTESAGFTKATNDIDLGVAQYLKARVSLWTGDYQACVNSCKDIMEHYSTFITEENYGVNSGCFDEIQAGKKDIHAEDNAFTCLKSNPECILGWVDGNGASTYYYEVFNVFAGDGTSTNPVYMRMDDHLFEMIDDNDFRKDNILVESKAFTYFKDKNTHTLPSYSSLKWGATIALQQTSRSEKMNTDQCLYRTSNVVLMLAEAYSELGDVASAKNTLDLLLKARTREGASTLTCDNYKGHLPLKDLIKLQWRIEMWGESGLDFYNTKRWNIPVDRNGSKIHWSIEKTLPLEYMTYEIPMQEYNFNPGWGR